MKTTIAHRKQSEGYRTKAPCCADCNHFTSLVEKVKTMGGTYSERETLLRCTGPIGGKVGKAAWCRSHDPKKQKETKRTNP